MDKALKPIRESRDKDAKLTTAQRRKRETDALKRFAERTGKTLVLVDPSEAAKTNQPNIPN